MNNSKYKTPFDSLPISFPFLKTSALRERETSPHKKKERGSHGLKVVSIENSVSTLSVSEEKLVTHLYCFC